MKSYLLSFIVFLLSVSFVPAATGKMEALQAGRYTRQKDSGVLVETGIYHASSVGFEAMSSAIYAESALGLSAATLTAVNGKVVAFKATIDLYNQINPGFLDNYKFSSAAYGLVGGDSYIVTLASGGSSTAPTVTVAASKAVISEGPVSTSNFRLTLNKAPTAAIVVLFEISGTAKSGSDYTSSNSIGSVRIKKGEKTGKVTITTLNDKKAERKETVIFKILPHGGYKVGTPKSATISITDND